MITSIYLIATAKPEQVSNAMVWLVVVEALIETSILIAAIVKIVFMGN